MPQRQERHIVPAGRKQWDVKEPGKAAPVSSHQTQEAAERAAKQDLENVGGGEAIIHGRDGRIRDSDTVAPAKDPHPPHDTRH